MKTVSFWALRFALVFVFLGVTYFEVLMAVFLVVGESGVINDPTTIIFRSFAILGAIGVQIVIVGVWILLTRVHKGTIFSSSAFKYVDMTMGAIVAISLVIVAVVGLMVLVENGDLPPGLVLFGLTAAAAVMGVALVVYTLRTLLAQAVARDVEASALEVELDGVV